MIVSVLLSEAVVKEARRIAASANRSVAKQIEYYFRLALIAEQNPDLSFSLIREIMMTEPEEATKEYTFG